MTLIDLMKDFKEELETVFKESKFETEAIQKVKEPQITIGWHIKKSTKHNLNDVEKAKEEFPSILITPVNQKDTSSGSSANLLIIFGAYSEDEDGWKDALSMAEKTRQHLKINYCIAKKYIINKTIEIDFPDVQPYPMFFCWMSVSFEMPDLVVENLEELNF